MCFNYRQYVSITLLECVWGGCFFPLCAGGMRTCHHFPEPDYDNPYPGSDDGGGFVGNTAACRSVPFTGTPWRSRAGPEACTSCCHATARQNLGYQTQLIHHVMVSQCPFKRVATRATHRLPVCLSRAVK